MLGTSSSKLDHKISTIINHINPSGILELGCGSGKLSQLVNDKKTRLHGVQKLFTPDDLKNLNELGYEKIIDRDILDFFKEGFDEQYQLIVAMDVIEHFMLSDALSIINFSLYRSDYMLLVWPSAHPQSALTNAYDRHRCSFEIRDIVNNFDVIYYSQTGFADFHLIHRYHIAVLRGFMNVKTIDAI